MHAAIENVDSNNNAVERINRGFVAIHSDGGGNRSEEGMYIIR